MSTWITKFVLAVRRIAGSLHVVMRPRIASILLLALCSIGTTQLYAADSNKTADSDKAAELLVLVLAAPDTVYTHPDLWYRSLGSSSYKEGFAAEAFTFFLRASRYADKPSQAIVATMYW